jgi:hypothetical protein
MALQHNLTLPSNIELPDAYAKVTCIHLTANEFLADVTWWAEEGARKTGLPTVHSASFSLPFQEMVSLEEAYEQLKLLPLFAGAEDI